MSRDQRAKGEAITVHVCWSQARLRRSTMPAERAEAEHGVPAANCRRVNLLQLLWNLGLPEMNVPDGWKQALRDTMQRQKSSSQ